jgi:hypothetical protein
VGRAKDLARAGQVGEGKVRDQGAGQVDRAKGVARVDQEAQAKGAATVAATGGAMGGGGATGSTTTGMDWVATIAQSCQ